MGEKMQANIVCVRVCECVCVCVCECVYGRGVGIVCNHTACSLAPPPLARPLPWFAATARCTAYKYSIVVD